MKDAKLKVIIESCSTLLIPIQKKTTVKADGEMKVVTEIEKIKNSVNRM